MIELTHEERITHLEDVVLRQSQLIARISGALLKQSGIVKKITELVVELAIKVEGEEGKEDD
jgi:uncharacterized coiled-coil protein SlyX